MVASNLVLIAGAGGVGRTVLDRLRAQDVPVRALVRRDDDRAAELRSLSAEVVIGDLTRPESVAAALEGVGRMYFAMPVSPDHLLVRLRGAGGGPKCSRRRACRRIPNSTSPPWPDCTARTATTAHPTTSNA